MGKHFGELFYLRGIVYYKLSHHEQKPFAKAISVGIPNIVNRTSATVLYWLPTFIIGYLTFTTVEAMHKASLRKNPMDYKNEVDPNAVEEPVEEKKKKKC